MARSTICGSMGHEKKYDLLPLVLWFCGSMARSTVLLPLVFVVVWGHGKKYDLLPPVFVVV